MTPAARFYDMLHPAVSEGVKMARRKFKNPTEDDLAEAIAEAWELEVMKSHSERT